MDASVAGVSAERRRAPRFNRRADHRIVDARIRPGHGAAVLDVSARGALIETARRLLPGSTVDLFIKTMEGEIVMKGSIVRCTVTQVCGTAIRYQAGIAFAMPLSWLHGHG